jgi:hypothetical protein
MSAFTKIWNQQQKELRQLLLSDDRHQEAIELFLSQHALLHSAKLLLDEPFSGEAISLEDDLLDNMTEDQFRRIPQNDEHSVAWLIWHIVRIEDVTMNVLVAGLAQIMHRDNWLARMKIELRHTGNLMSEDEVTQLSAAIDMQALRAYRVAVGRGTREIVRQLQPGELTQKVNPLRLEQLMVEGAVIEEARDLINYWGKRSIAGLLLMPATRHNPVHLNEAQRLKQKRQ